MTRRSCVPRAATLAVVLGLVPGLCCAGMTDPTRPLGGLASGDAAAVAPGSVRGPVPAAAPAAPPAEPQLQSLQLPRDGVASALVDGQLLRAGQRWNAFEIVAIDAQGVLAKGPGGPQRWTLVGVQYLDPKARARLPAPVPAAPVAAAVASAVSLAPTSRAAPTPTTSLHTAQWQYTPVTSSAPALPPVTRLSWADLVAPAPRTSPPKKTAATAVPRPVAAQRVPTAQVPAMLVAAGPSRPALSQALAKAPSGETARWRGLRFEWPAQASAPSLALTHTSVLRRTKQRSPRPAPARVWAHQTPIPHHAPSYALRSPLTRTPTRHAGPHLVGVVALNKETP
ncbi:hypothetical protein KAK06_07635 [Ideonella sp. 4Y11]|uniref:Uncharacterized protein n=1 Tax=Ideonella aquatica TaxID=2824119 RepID=A0A941BIR3_9BURK|nr:hypothetical protein [Ideonella aquatica]MBQ0958827.1 hypothetical protein [Ideonella aquatica]